MSLEKVVHCVYAQPSSHEHTVKGAPYGPRYR